MTKKRKISQMQLRREAAEAGHRAYAGNPCKVCGSVRRYTMSGKCIQCQKRNSRERYSREVAEMKALLQAGGA